MPTREEAIHGCIVEAAVRAIRSIGYAGTGIADIMKNVGLTHGCFYTHFAFARGNARRTDGSRRNAALGSIAAGVLPGQALASFVCAYFTKEPYRRRFGNTPLDA